MKYHFSNDPRQVPNQYKTCSTNRKWSNEVIKVDPNHWGRPGGSLEGQKSSKYAKKSNWPAPKSGREGLNHPQTLLKHYIII